MLKYLDRQRKHHEITALRTEFRAIATDIAQRDPCKARTLLAMLNYLLPCSLRKVYKFKCGKLRASQKIDEAGLAKIMAEDNDSHIGIAATTGMAKYLGTFWAEQGQQIYGSRPTLVKYRGELQALGLFKVAERWFGDGIRRSTEYCCLAVAECLLLAEALEAALLDLLYRFTDSRKGDLDFLPGHRAYSLVKLFNAIFWSHNLQWRREWIDEPVMPVFGLSDDAELAPDWAN